MYFAGKHIFLSETCKHIAEHMLSIFDVAFESFIDMSHKLVLLSKLVDREAAGPESSEHFCVDNGINAYP